MTIQVLRGCMAAAQIFVLSLASFSTAANETPRQGSFAQMKRIEGIWVATGKGFSSKLAYELALPGAVVRGRNELRNLDGVVVRKYEGLYAWDAASEQVAFFTASDVGELHRGEAVWRHEQLWHKATVTGGSSQGYRSVIQIVGEELHYRAIYDPNVSDAEVLAAPSLVYRRSR